LSSINPGTIEKAVRGNQQAMRTVLNAMAAQFLVPGQPPLLEPTSGGKPATPVTSVPPQASLSVTGANGAYTIAVTNPTQTVPATLYHEVSYSTSSNFGNPTTLPLTPSTGFTFNAPGTTLFWRIRSSYDQSHFNAYRPAQGNAAVSAALQSSVATENNVPLNQSNYGIIDSVDNGAGSANVRVFGTSGPGTMYPAVKGAQETILPSATIVNVPFGSNPVVAYDGEQYLVKSTLPQVFADGLTPTGSVSVVGGGAVVLPTVALVLDSHGHVIAWNVLTQGNGLTADVTLAIVTSTGSGATPGAQTISGGKLISIAPGNPGDLYNPADTVTVSGGAAATGVGGGQAIGGNNGRFVYADPTTGGL
jgi:hypothetical protein